MKRTKIMLLIATTVLGAGLLSGCSKKHEHSYGEWEVKDSATHTHDGVQHRDCDCGECEEAPLPKTNAHEWSEWQITKPATHTEDGIRTRTCPCGASENEVISKTNGHEWGEWIIKEEPTHTKNGTRERTCACGAKETETVTRTNEHSWSDWSIVTPATHFQEGLQKRTCACGEIETVAIPKTGAHMWSDWEVKLSPTHTQEGYKQRTCACGETETIVLDKLTGHEWGEWKTIKSATHTKVGVKRRTCACGATEDGEIEKTPEHEWGAWQITKAATCKETGLQRRTCACGAVEEVTLAKIGAHVWSEWQVGQAATHTQTGYKKRVCTICNAEERITIDKTTAHEWGAWQTITQADCTNTGLQRRTCACGAKEEQAIPALGHSYDSTFISKDPSVGIKGEVTRHCQRCDQNFKEELPADSVDLDASKWLRQPTQDTSTPADGIYMIKTIAGRTYVAEGLAYKLNQTIPATCEEPKKQVYTTFTNENRNILAATLGVNTLYNSSDFTTSLMQKIDLEFTKNIGDPTGHTMVNGTCTACGHEGLVFNVVDIMKLTSSSERAFVGTVQQGEIKPGQSIQIVKNGYSEDKTFKVKRIEKAHNTINVANASTGEVGIIFEDSALLDGYTRGCCYITNTSEVQFNDIFECTFYLNGARNTPIINDYPGDFVSFTPSVKINGAEHRFSFIFDNNDVETFFRGTSQPITAVFDDFVLPNFANNFQYEVYSGTTLIGYLVKGLTTGTWVDDTKVTVRSGRDSATKVTSLPSHYAKDGKFYEDPICSKEMDFDYYFLAGVNTVSTGSTQTRFTLYNDYFKYDGITLSNLLKKDFTIYYKVESFVTQKSFSVKVATISLSSGNCTILVDNSSMPTLPDDLSYFSSVAVSKS